MLPMAIDKLAEEAHLPSHPGIQVDVALSVEQGLGVAASD
jgi:hypothetical protein